MGEGVRGGETHGGSERARLIKLLVFDTIPGLRLFVQCNSGIAPPIQPLWPFWCTWQDHPDQAHLHYSKTKSGGSVRVNTSIHMEGAAQRKKNA